jgi:hypothetical protein
VGELLKTAEAFLSSDALDAKLVTCAVLAKATPRGLAEFAAQGAEHATLVTKLLADRALMKAMLAAGGAQGGKYGRAMEIYAAIQKASPRALVKATVTDADKKIVTAANGAITIAAGKNTLRLTRPAGSRGLSIKEFTLTPKS